jgi:hypothetical protein
MIYYELLSGGIDMYPSYGKNLAGSGRWGCGIVMTRRQGDLSVCVHGSPS